MATVPLLTTNLYTPPPRPDLLSRPRLVRRLEEGLRPGHRLTLISAPAGYGKTTLLGEWAAHLDQAVAWVSLDAEDDDHARFWTYVIAALQQVAPDVHEIVPDGLGSPHRPLREALLSSLINRLAARADPLFLILDDYHFVTGSQIHRGITFLLEHQPDSVHLVLSTRADPPLPLFRLRARGQLTEIRSRDLRFTSDEANTFLNAVMDLALSSDDVETLETRTEGWIVGLQLAALSLQGRPDPETFIAAFSGSHHYVLEYLTGEVLRRQPDPIQRFLMETSILDRLCGPLCDALTDKSGGQAVLAHLHRRDMFILPLDDEHRWYRYHHLFADLLRNLARQALPREHIRELHLQASKWHERNDDLEEGIKHALRRGDFERSADLIEQAIRTTLSRGRVTSLLRWSEGLPKAIVRSRPRLLMYQGYAMFLNARLPLAKPMFQDARDALVGMPSSPENDALRGELAAMLATISVVEQDIGGAIEEAQEGLTYASEDDLITRARASRALGVAHGTIGDTDRAVRMLSQAKSLALAAQNHFLAAENISQLGATRMHQGRLRQAARAYQEILALVEAPSGFPPAGLGYIGLAEVNLEWNELRTVEDCLDKGIELCQRGGIGYALRPAYCVQALLRHALGDTEGALAAMQRAEAFDPTVATAERVVQTTSYEVRLRLALGHLHTARDWATGKGIVPHVSYEDLPIVLREMQQVSLARVLLAEDESNGVLEICRRLYPMAKPAGRLARVIEGRLLEALALQQLGDRDAALASFERCLALAEREGYVRLFLEAGDPAITLLRDAASRRIAPRYATRLLRAFGGLAAERGDATSPGTLAQPLVEPLSERELDVLLLISEGSSNQQIAETLIVTVHTVKKHASNIYGKLGVRNRTQAVARARELGILP
jgi:LuxR family maltose regulon positive regulatory protein